MLRLRDGGRQKCENYKRNLELRPESPEVRERLAEIYLELLLKEYEVLEAYGDAAEVERVDLRDAFRSAMSQMKIAEQEEATDPEDAAEAADVAIEAK